MINNWYCNNCQSYQDSWAEYQSHKPNEAYRRDIRCWKCKEEYKRSLLAIHILSISSFS